MIHFAHAATTAVPVATDSVIPEVHGGSTVRHAPDTDALGDQIAELAAHIHAATHRLLVLLDEFDRREGWGGGGFRSCAHWLSWRTGIALGAAREKVRVARALPDLPTISEAMRRGELSYSKVRALTRMATPENEGDLLEFARHGTTAHVERLVRAWRQVDRQEAAELERARHDARSFTVYEADDGSWVVRGHLDPEVGAVLRKALDAAVEELRVSGRAEARDDGELGSRCGSPQLDGPTHGQRLADAIGLVAERSLASNETSRRAERFQVVVHVGEQGVLGGAPGDLHVSAETFRRFSCDATLVRMEHDDRGRVLDVGRRSRTVPPALRRALEYRDGTCRFPGCRVRHTDAHHVRHWADGGETALDNLVLLCRWHHRAVHEGEVEVEVVGDGRFRFRHPGGRTVPEVGPVLALPSDPVSSLIDRHRKMGITPSSWTTTPDWTGEALDLGLAVEVLRSQGRGSTRHEPRRPFVP